MTNINRESTLENISIYINPVVGMFVCLSVCLSVTSNILRLKSERHETRHVGPLGTLEGFRSNGFLNFDLEVKFWQKVYFLDNCHYIKNYLSQCLKNRHGSSLTHSLTDESIKNAKSFFWL